MPVSLGEEFNRLLGQSLRSAHGNLGLLATSAVRVSSDNPGRSSLLISAHPRNCLTVDRAGGPLGIIMPAISSAGGRTAGAAPAPPEALSWQPARGHRPRLDS